MSLAPIMIGMMKLPNVDADHDDRGRDHDDPVHADDRVVGRRREHLRAGLRLLEADHPRARHRPRGTARARCTGTGHRPPCGRCRSGSSARRPRPRRRSPVPRRAVVSGRPSPHRSGKLNAPMPTRKKIANATYADDQRRVAAVARRGDLVADDAGDDRRDEADDQAREDAREQFRPACAAGAPAPWVSARALMSSSFLRVLWPPFAVIQLANVRFGDDLNPDHMYVW